MTHDIYSMEGFLIYMSSFLAFLSYVFYITAILKGQAKPHRTTRFVLVLISGTATISLFAQSSSVAIWLPGMFTIGSLIIFILSLKFGMGGWSKIDLLSLVFSIAGILFWKMTNNPSYALFASIAADFIGQIPMFIKTFHFPKTETWSVYCLGSLAALTSLLALQQWTLQEYCYPLYIAITDGLVVILILRKKITEFFLNLQTN